MPGLTAQPLRPAGTTGAPALPPLPLPPTLLPPLLPPEPEPAVPVLVVTQTLFVQAWFEPQGMPQPPQLAELVVVSTQAPEQTVVPVGQLEVHWEATQNGAVDSQTLPHVPQFVALVLRSVQTPLHMFAHCVGEPAEPFAPPVPLPAPAVAVLPLPAEPGGPPGVVGSDEQLMASNAGTTSASEALTNCARNARGFSRNRFHIGAPNL
jgi:hypothetical protein